MIAADTPGEYDPVAELVDRCERVRLLLLHAYEVRAALAGGDAPGGPLRRLLHENVEPGWVPRSPAITAALAAIDAQLATRLAGRATPFTRLVDLLRLDAIEQDLLLAALAPTVRRGLREALLVLGPELAPGVHFAAHLVELVADSLAASLRARAAVADGAPLVASGALVAEAAPLATAPLWRPVAVAETVRRWLDGAPSLAPRLDLVGPLAALVDDATAAALDRLASAPAPHLVIVGPPRSGRTRVAAALASRLRRPAAILTATSLREARGALLDARLRGHLLFVPLGEAPLEPALAAALAALEVPCVVAAPPASASLGGLAAAGFLRLALSEPSPALQVEAWRRSLGGDLPGAELEELVRGHALDLTAIELAAAEVRSRGVGVAPAALLHAAERAARDAQSSRLAAVADRLSTTLTWDDLVLPAEVRASVDEVWRAAASRRTVFEQWGFDLRTPYGRAISALFAGDAGTGKTMVATLIARQLGLELYRVDLSRLVDKYIGETEKHLATLFAEAERGRCAILFDEADALFGKRTSKGDSSTERYANMEVNYLLQRIETFSGLAILTTNQESVIDTAFKRRIRYVVHFPFPDAAERAEMWRRLIPPEAPLAADFDAAALARRYEISGGHIKSAVLRAAFAAAAAAAPLDQRRLLRAADQELENMGKLVRR